MISRADTVNLSNMPAISEGPYTQVEVEQGVGKLTKMFAKLSTTEEGWKITKFDKTPPVSGPLPTMRLPH